MLDLLDLTGKREAFVNSLSRGMKQRLCLAKTLVHDPPVLILDEPASGLDPRARIEVKALFKELRRMGKTILISSHILTELADCCTSIGIIERGKLLMHGPIDEVYHRIRRNRIVRIKFLENMEAGVSILRSLPETRDVQIENNHVTVELAADDQQVAALLERLVAAGVRMQLLRREGADAGRRVHDGHQGSGGVGNDEIRMTNGNDGHSSFVIRASSLIRHSSFELRHSPMYLLENPVLQRELLVNLRMMRGFVLLFAYVAMLGAVVYVAWPSSQRLDLTHAARPRRGSWSICSSWANTCCCR